MARAPFTEREVSAMIIGTIKEMVKNSYYYYHSSVGPDYSHFTEAGREAITRQMELFSNYMLTAMKEEDIRRSKELVFNELKGEK